MIEYYESNVLTVKQRLLDVRKINDQNLGPDKMLENLRVETRKNRELNNEILGRELNDKRERLQRTELLLQEPMTTQSELERLSNDVKKLQRECMALEDKLKQNAPADDKLAIFKSQAAMLSKKKEQKNADIKKMEVEKLALERTLADKEGEYARVKGGKYMKRDDFRQYQANIRAKHNSYKDMKKQLQELKAEANVLAKTRDILGSKAEDLGIAVRELEAEKGISGYTAVES